MHYPRILAAVVICLLASGIYAQDADFGDLPDPGFPTLRDPVSTGPYHLDVSHEAIGVTLGTTTTEPDAKFSDEDDGFPYIGISNIMLGGVFSQGGKVSVPVTTDNDSAIRYLNVVADLNGDGVFQSYTSGLYTQHEWLACNVPILFQNATKVVSSYFTLLAR